MTPQEAAVVLGKCAAFDNRRPDPVTTAAWAEALDPNLTLTDALAIVTDHYANSREWIMPADINTRSRMIRRQRIKALGGKPVYPDGLEDEPQVEATWRERFYRHIGDGLAEADAKATAWADIHREPPMPLPPADKTLTLPELRKAAK